MMSQESAAAVLSKGGGSGRNTRPVFSPSSAGDILKKKSYCSCEYAN